MIKPELDWKPFDYKNPPSDLPIAIECDINYLILIADYGYHPTENMVPEYYTDIATAYGSYLDNFWDTENDWDEGQVLHVVSYCSIIGDQVKLEKENDIAVAYICDGTACKDCNSQSECTHTTEIKYAKHFKKLVPGRYFEQGGRKMKHEFVKRQDPLHKVIVKFSDKKEETMLFFEPEVHISYYLITGQIGVYDEPGNCLFLTHWNLVDYCLVVTDVMLKTN